MSWPHFYDFSQFFLSTIILGSFQKCVYVCVHVCLHKYIQTLTEAL